MGAVVVELPCGACGFFVDEGVSRDGGLGAVDAQIVAWTNLPYNQRRCDLGRRDDDFADSLVLFDVNECKLFEQVLLVAPLRLIMLNEGDEERRFAFGMEVSRGYSGAFAGMVDPPDWEVVACEVLGLQYGPIVLLDGGADRLR